MPPSPGPIYEFLEARGMKYAIRLPANKVLQENIAFLLRRPVGRPPHEVRRFHVSFSYRAASWDRPPRIVAKVEWHPGELLPRVGFIVTNLTRPAEGVVAFYNHRGTSERRSAEPDCRAVASPPTPSDFSCTRWPTTWAPSCGPWRCPRGWSGVR
jgi:hypothetical protein